MIKLLLLGLALFLLFPLPEAAGDSPPGSGIAGTKHDFTSERYRPYDNPEVSAVGLCTFCHTPHRGIRTQLLWNHSLPATDFYSWGPEEPATQGGTPLPRISPSYMGSTSLCLSCHDGSVGTAIGDIAWFDARSFRGSQAINQNKGIGNMGYHPVAVPYPYGGVPNSYNGVITGSNLDTYKFVPDPTINGVRLFNDSNGKIQAGAQPLASGIECSSCHDPHNGPSVKDSKFLRADCEACHIK